MLLKNKVAIITGGSSGIGLATAKRFAKEGAKVVIAGRDQKKGENALKDIPEAIFVATDVQKEADLQKLVAETIKKFGQIDIVFNNAGRISTLEEDITTMPVADFHETMETNFTSVFLLTRLAIPYLLKTKGCIVNTASVLGLKPDMYDPIYCSSKAAIVMFTKTMALKYARDGVRVNCVCPGPIDTPLLRDAYGHDERDLKEGMKRNPMGRMGTSEEVANLVCFLASAEAAYITGSIVSVDGGAALK